jgi:anaphase-promoting complex subunit 8
MATLSNAELAQLQSHLQTAATSCTDRCLYQSAKWAAELLNSFESLVPTSPELVAKTLQSDAKEAQLEARELPKYLLAKTYFDCREFDRCAGVFLPGTLPKSTLPKGKDGKKKSRESDVSTNPALDDAVQSLSQKALFLALYAKYMSGEKRKDEESEMILGPADGGVTINRELSGISRVLEDWFDAKHAKSEEGLGWLEYLYGIVLAKGKNEDLAKRWFIRSVHLYPYNWGAWSELSSLISTTDEVSKGERYAKSLLIHEQLTVISEQLPQNIMAYIFYVYTSQELAQHNDIIHNQLTQVLHIFPNSSFLKTQRALMYYHSKGETAPFTAAELRLTQSL